MAAEGNELTIAMRLRGARAVNSELGMTAKQINAINASAKRTAAPLARMGKSMERTGGILTRRLTLPIAVAAGWGVKMGVDFEDAMQKIVGLVGVSQKQVNAWKEDIKGISSESTISMDGLADALFFVTSAGFRGAAAIRVLRASALASAAGLGDTKTVADAVTSAVNAYGEKTLSASKATDVLVAGVREGKMPVEALAGSIGQVLGVASEVGVSFAEVTATAAALSRVGAPVNRTMTGIRFLLANMVNPTSKAANVLKKIGVNADDLRESIRKRGLIATLQDLKKQLPIGDFLKVVGGARGVVVALGLVGKQADKTKGILDRTKNSTGSAARAFEAASESPGFKFRKAINNLKIALEEFGDVITPALLAIASGISGLAEGFHNLGKGGTVLAIALFTLGPLLKLLGFGMKIAAARTFLAAGGMFTMAEGTYGLSAALLALAANPVGAIVLGLALIAVGLVILYFKVKAFRDIVNATVTWMAKHWRLLVMLVAGPLLGAGIIAVVNHFQTLLTIVRKVIHWIEVLSAKIGKIAGHFGFLGKVAKGGGGIIGKGADLAEGILGRFASGGNVTTTGPYLVGERGPEVVTLPRGGHVTSNAELRGRELVTAPIVVQLDGKTVAESTARVTADRRARR